MAQYNTASTLSGLFKEVYADGIQNLIPECGKLVKMIPFVQRDKETGDVYAQPVILAAEQGFTYAASSDGAFALNDHIAAQLGDATLDGSDVLLRSAIGYNAAAKASNSKKAFVKATELLVENMTESMTKRLEIAILHGQSGIGVADSSVNTNSTTTVVQMTTASWASGIWAGMENAQIQFYNGASLISSGSNSIFVISVVDEANKKLTVTGTSTGITALDSALGSGDLDVYFYGAYGKEMAGLRKWFTNTGSLAGISAASYALWKGNSVTVTGQLSFGKLMGAISKAVARGLQSKAVVLVNPVTWMNLNSDLAALRQFDSSYKAASGELGVESLKYHGVNGEIEIVSHILVKEGEAFVFPLKKVKRIGAQDMSFNTPGREDEIFLQLPSNAGFELRCYASQAIFVEAPAQCVYISGFTNSTL